MRRRVIKPEIHTDAKTGTLSDVAFRLFMGLLNFSDDVGVIEFNPTELRARIFPHRGGDEQGALALVCNPLFDELVPKRLVQIIQHASDGDGFKSYLYITNFLKHQRVDHPATPVIPGWRAGESIGQFIARSGTTETIENEWFTEIMSMSGCEAPAARRLLAKNHEASKSTHGAIAPKLSKGKSIQSKGSKEDVCAAASATPPSPVVAFLQLNDSTKYEITKAMVDEWVALYPATDVMQQLRNMYGWLEGNPENRKTRTGVMRFIHRWLGKEQNSARAHSSTKASNRQRAISAAAESVD